MRAPAPNAHWLKSRADYYFAYTICMTNHANLAWTWRKSKVKPSIFQHLFNQSHAEAQALTQPQVAARSFPVPWMRGFCRCGWWTRDARRRSECAAGWNSFPYATTPHRFLANFARSNLGNSNSVKDASKRKRLRSFVVWLPCIHLC